ncbi:hypothetical protein D9M71_678870 [compost metagenome]
MLANEMLETMRSNRDQLYTVAGEIDSSSAYFTTGEDFPDLLAASECQPLPSNANPGKQLSCWLTRVRQVLPGSSNLFSEIHVCRAGNTAGSCGTSGRAVEIQVAWTVKSGECLDNADSGDDQTICRYRIRAEI